MRSNAQLLVALLLAAWLERSGVGALLQDRDDEPNPNQVPSVEDFLRRSEASGVLQRSLET